MKKVAVFLLVLTALPAYTDDMQAYLSETQEMVQEGKHEEALKRFIWFHDHALEHDPSMYGVRLSFALSYWKALGEVYDPAMTALVETRDRKETSLLNGDGDVKLFHDVAALNRTLEEDEKTVSLFSNIVQKDPAVGKRYWNIASDAVIDAKRYDLVRKYIGNPMREFTKVKSMYEYNTALYDDPDIGSEHFKAYNEENLVEESLRLIDVALALDDREAAREIQRKAMSLVKDYRLEDALPPEDNEDDIESDTDEK